MTALKLKLKLTYLSPASDLSPATDLAPVTDLSLVISLVFSLFDLTLDMKGKLTTSRSHVSKNPAMIDVNVFFYSKVTHFI